jgi:hypothetical protein
VEADGVLVLYLAREEQEIEKHKDITKEIDKEMAASHIVNWHCFPRPTLKAS